VDSERLECKLERGVMTMAKLRKMLTHLGKNESGQGVLAIVLILLMLGAVIITPLLVFMSTGLKAGQVYESKLQEFYAADAGVGDGLWQIKHDHLDEKFSSPAYDPYDFQTVYSYPAPPLEVNDRDVYVSIANVWIPTSGIPNDPGSIIEDAMLIVTGKVITFPGGEWGYQIRITYNYQDGDPDGTNLNVDDIGVWLPAGFDYVAGGQGNLDSYSYDVSAHCGGKAIVWDVNQAFKLPGDTGYPLIRTFEFQYSPEGQYPQAVSWITTTGVGAIPLSWDADVRPYRIESIAGNTTVKAYVIREEFRKLGAAIPGDYAAVGNTLMTATGDEKYRDSLYQEASATITDAHIPSDATVEAAFLYWSGWIDFHYWRSWWFGGWREIDELKYSYDTTPDKHILVNETAKVDRVSFGIEGNMAEISADGWQVEENSGDGGWFGTGLEDTWSYACFADVTPLVKGFIAADEIDPNGAGEYTLGHADSVIGVQRSPSEYYFDFDDTGEGTGYPLGTPAIKPSWGYETRYQYAYAGWSLVIIYSNPETKGHQLYIYGVQTGDFGFVNGQASGGEELEIPISGFLAPSDTTGSRLTCFVGEGDSHYGCGSGGDDYLEVNGYRLSDTVNPECNVWNSYSNALDDPSINGIDIDTFDMSGCIVSGATSATVTVGSEYEIYNVVYIILSFRSDIGTTGGIVSYLIS